MKVKPRTYRKVSRKRYLAAGGHLSLILATKGGPGDLESEDPIDHVTGAVQDAAVFYPPTGYRNWSEAGDMAVGIGKQA